jgi:acylphosphatase
VISPGTAVCRRVIVSGRVQGVGFRISCYRRATRLGLAGTVRNLPDGRVEVVAEGEREAVNELVAWCRRGPPAAWVAEASVTDEEPHGWAGFLIA